MKKLFFSMVLTLTGVAATFAQSSLIATLSHEGNVQVFHGPTSYKQAMAAAEDGDVISLAGGIYEATDITKGITLRGSGVEKDTISNAYPTELQGTFSIEIPDSCSSLVIEGVYCSSSITLMNLKNPVFMKCKFNGIGQGNFTAPPTVNNLTMLHCYVTNRMKLSSSSTANLINSYFGDLRECTSLDVTNCYIRCHSSSISKSQFRNCLIRSYTTGDANFSQTNMVYNCVGASENRYYSIFANHSINNNIQLANSDFDALFTSTGFYQLTDEAKAKYKGDDGTEVGLYGGSLPYDLHIAKPQITKCNIAQKTTADGKLSVDIEVKGVE